MTTEAESAGTRSTAASARGTAAAPEYRSDRSFVSHSPRGRLFGILLPRGVSGDDLSYFRRAGACYQFQSADQMGISPLLRLLPATGLAAAFAIALVGIVLVQQAHQHLSGRELLACAGLAVLVAAMVLGLSWLLKDLTRAAIIDTRNRIVWLGGGWAGRWQAVNFSIIKHTRVVQRGESDAEYPYVVELVDLDGDRYAVCEEMTAELANQAGAELADKIGVSCQALAQDAGTQASQ